MLKYVLATLLFFPLAVLAAKSVDLSTVNKLPQPGTVALTFDDGPNPVYTRQILATLKKYNIKATFFMTGANARKYPDVVKAIYAQGHTIASHTMSHPMLTKIPEKQLAYEIASPSQIITGIIGVKPKCLRYPFNDSNLHVREEIRANGMVPVPMGFNSFDYERPGTDKIVSWVLKNVYSRQVILMHDGYDKREETVAALPQIIEGIKKKGLGFSAICS